LRTIAPLLLHITLTAPMNPIESFLRHYLSQPVPPNLERLFAITDKKELIRFVKSIHISADELAILAHTSRRIGYFHFIEFGEWIPPHLQPTKEEKTAFQRTAVGKLDPKAAKLFSKISNILKERIYRVGHLFVGRERWHLLFLELRDIKEEDNHWAAGPHIHFTNDLCSSLRIDDVSKKFTTLDFDLGQRLHIRWRDE
jgi:hypothetical protein